MDEKLKAKWVAALRSGKYEQCKNRLSDGKGGYCCYGVLRHVANPTDTRSAQDRNSTLTRDQLKEYGFDPYMFERARLECMNDGHDPDKTYDIDRQYSFAEIADYIEKNL